MLALLLVGVVAYPLLPVAPLPQIDFPTITVTAQLARRLAGDDGLLGRAAAGAPVRADRRRLADDLDQFARRRPRSRCSSTSTATSTPPPTTCRRRSTPPAGSCRRTCRARRPIARSTRPTRRSCILSVTSDVEPLVEVDDVAENILAQRISQISGVSLVRIGGQQQKAIRIQIDPAKLVEKDLQLEDVRSADHERHGRQRRRARSSATSRRSRSTTTTS